MAAWTIKVRAGSKVERARHDDLDAALADVEGRIRELERSATGRTVKSPFGRDYEPVRQVIGRIELAGPGRVRAGVDVRGDGSSEVWTGRLRREVVERRRKESALDALRRAASG
ncbi:MAG: hypothetical protein QOE06_2730 [Thermoleophilaceae bacterium]|jgi:hypothetical protein|nr:hypothetical protein [Thermoleophilaceae bacterium]